MEVSDRQKLPDRYNEWSVKSNIEGNREPWLVSTRPAFVLNERINILALKPTSEYLWSIVSSHAKGDKTRYYQAGDIVS